MKESTLDWFDGEIKANLNCVKKTTSSEVCERFISRFKNKWQYFIEGLELLKLRQEANKTSVLNYIDNLKKVLKKKNHFHQYKWCLCLNVTIEDERTKSWPKKIECDD